jgi:Flp pilus assembly protein TadD
MKDAQNKFGLVGETSTKGDCTAFLRVSSLITLFMAILMVVNGLSPSPSYGRKRTAGKKSAASYLADGKKQMNRNRHKSAIRLFSAAIRKDSRMAQAYKLRGYSYEQIGRPNSAVRDFTRYIELNPLDSSAYLLRADALNFNYLHERALKDYDAAIRLKPSSVDAHLGRGLALMGLGKYDSAARSYRRALKLDSGNRDAVTNLGIAYMKAGKSRHALACLNTALTREQDSVWRTQIREWMAELLKDPAISAEYRAKFQRAAPRLPFDSLW